MLTSETSVNDLSNVDRNLKKVNLLEERKKLCEALKALKQKKKFSAISLLLSLLFSCLCFVFSNETIIGFFFTLFILTILMAILSINAPKKRYKSLLLKYEKELSLIFREWADNLSQEEFKNAMITMLEKLGLTVTLTQIKNEKNCI